MNPHLIILFVVLPMSAGIASLLWHHCKKTQRVLGVTFLVGNSAMALLTLFATLSAADPVARVLVSQMGNWPAPFGITIAVDPLSALMLAVSSVTCLAVFLYCIGHLPDEHSGGYFHATFHFLMMGVQWAFITGDLFNLFVAFEIMLIASYVLFISGTTKAQMRQAYKYVLLNLIGSTLFVTVMGWLYGQTGTLNMADLARMAMHGRLPPQTVTVAAMLLIVFAGKSAVFPLWFWLPEAYPTLPAAVVGLFAGLLTKVGAYVLLRVFVMIFGTSALIVQTLWPVLAIAAGVTMFLGVLGAVSMHTVRRILSIHIISQVGYMVMGVTLGITLGAATQSRVLAVAGAIFFILHNMVVKCCLFLCGGLMQEHFRNGSDTLEEMGGLLRRAPWLACLFLIAALSLAGLPPLSGFFGKWVLIHEAMAQGQWTLTLFALATSLLTLLSMLKIWSYGFWSPVRTEGGAKPPAAWGLGSVAMLVAVALSMGLGAQWYLEACVTAAQTLVDPRAYVSAVLGPYGEASAQR